MSHVRTWLVWCCALWLCALCGACSSETTPTQFLVVVDSDLSVDTGSADALKMVSIAVRRVDNGEEVVASHQFALSEAPTKTTEFRLPLSFALTPVNVEEGTLFRVTLTGENQSGETIAERQVITAFRPGAALRLDVFLAATCLRKLCHMESAPATCDPVVGECEAVPELRDLPPLTSGELSGYVTTAPKRGDAGVESDAGERKCASNAECDDGLYCNGEEQCDPGSLKANRMGCVPGAAPSCPTQQTCDEASDRCTSCALIPDGDRDGVNAKACGGTDCNDGDPTVAPNQLEICDGKDNDCDERSDNAATGGSVCSVAMDAGVDAAVADAGMAADGGAPRMDGGSDAGVRDAGPLDAGPMDGGARDSGPADAGRDTGVDSAVPLTAGCGMRSTAACSSFINAWDAEVAMGSYGAIMEPNVGEGFEVALQTNDNATDCKAFTEAIVGTAVSAALFDTGNLNLSLHTLYRPARWVPGEKYPLIVWGNGTCLQPEAYGAQLRSLASQGFIVVAPNARYVNTGSSADALTRALNFATGLNSDSTSPYFGRIDTSKIGAMGHSQGSQAVVNLALDSRVDAVVLLNGGLSASKPSLAISADQDIVSRQISEFSAAVNAVPKAAYLYFHMVPTRSDTQFTGYLISMIQPTRVTEPVNAWWKYLLNGDTNAGNWFSGTSCSLCNRSSELEFGQHGL